MGKNKYPTPAQVRKFKGTPHQREVYALGGTLIYPPLPSPEKFQAELAQYAPGCGSPTHVAGTNGGTMPCGAKLHGRPYFCAACQAKGVVEQLLNTAHR